MHWWVISLIKKYLFFKNKRLQTLYKLLTTSVFDLSLTVHGINLYFFQYTHTVCIYSNIIHSTRADLIWAFPHAQNFCRGLRLTECGAQGLCPLATVPCSRALLSPPCQSQPSPLCMGARIEGDPGGQGCCSCHYLQNASCVLSWFPRFSFFLPPSWALKDSLRFCALSGYFFCQVNRVGHIRIYYLH